MEQRDGNSGNDVTAGDGGHDVEVAEAIVHGSAFAIDVAIASLAAEGIEVVRSSPADVGLRLGDLNRQGEHRLVFRTADGVRVAQVLHEAGVL